MSAQNSGPLTDSYGMIAGDVSDLRKSVPIAWPEAQRICDIPEVREALDKFAADAHEENMLAMVSAIMGHAVAQGRAAGLEEERELTSRHYRKKPVVIEAVQFTEALRDAHLFDGAPLPSGVKIPRKWLHPPSRKVYSADAYIETLEGRMEVSLNDWIITGVKGEHYPCKPDIFAATYEPALSPTPSDAGKGDALLTIARDALDEIALAGMSGSGQESEEGMRDWHARRAWEFIGIAARAKTEIDAALSSLEVIGKGEKG
jgi:hypothetical protein